jgi:hypothetical protein
MKGLLSSGGRLRLNATPFLPVAQINEFLHDFSAVGTSMPADTVAIEKMKSEIENPVPEIHICRGG